MTFLSADDDGAAPSVDLDDVKHLLTAHRGRLQPAAVAAEMERFAADHDDALHRSCAEGHFTGSAAVVDAAGDRVLVLFHRKAQRWLQPGGHADGDANLAAVALREATEETGIVGLRVWSEPIDVDIHEVRFPDAPPHLHLDVRFLVVAPSDAVLAGNHESEAVRWIELTELDAVDADESLRRLSSKALRLAPTVLGS